MGRRSRAEPPRAAPRAVKRAAPRRDRGRQRRRDRGVASRGLFPPEVSRSSTTQGEAGKRDRRPLESTLDGIGARVTGATAVGSVVWVDATEELAVARVRCAVVAPRAATPAVAAAAEAATLARSTQVVAPAHAAQEEGGGGGVGGSVGGEGNARCCVGISG